MLEVAKKYRIEGPFVGKPAGYCGQLTYAMTTKR